MRIQYLTIQFLYFTGKFNNTMCIIGDIKKRIIEAETRANECEAAAWEALKSGPDGKYKRDDAWFVCNEAEEEEEQWLAEVETLQAQLTELIAQGVVEEPVEEPVVEPVEEPVVEPVAVPVAVPVRRTFAEVVGNVVGAVQEVVETAAGLPEGPSPLELLILQSGMTRNGNDALTLTGGHNDPKYIIDTLGNWEKAPGQNGGYASMVASMGEYHLRTALKWYVETDKGREQPWVGCIGKKFPMRYLLTMCQICNTATSDEERIIRAVNFCAEKNIPMWTSGEYNYDYLVPDGSKRTGHVFMLMRLMGVVVFLHNRSKPKKTKA